MDLSKRRGSGRSRSEAAPRKISSRPVGPDEVVCDTPQFVQK